MAATQTRAALVTGASSGIGLAIARMLASEGYALTVTARRPEKLEAAAEDLRRTGAQVRHVAGDIGDEHTVTRVVAEHEARYGRLDVLVNNAGVGAGGEISELQTSKIDLQLATNIRSIIMLYRAATPMLRTAGAEHRNALVVNTASITGIRGEAWLSVYSATKHAVVGFTQSMNIELGDAGIKNVVLCPGFVDTPMAQYVKHAVPVDDMITADDVAEGVRFVLRTSPGCVVPEIRFEPPQSEDRGRRAI